MQTVRKIKVVPKDKEFYTFFNNEQREQNKALNMAITYIHTNQILKNNDSGAEKRIQKSITNINKKIKDLEKQLKSKKITDEKKESVLKAIETNKKIIEAETNALEDSRQFRNELDLQFAEIYIEHNNLYQVLNAQTNVQYMRTLDLVKQKASADYKNNFVEIITGQCSLMNYKKDFPLMIDRKCINLYEEDEKYFIKTMLGYELEIILNNKLDKNVVELKCTLEKCINKDYRICQSSLMKDNKGRLIFNLNLDIPYTSKYEPIEGKTLGVDLGIKYPIYAAVADEPFKRTSIGSINNLLKVRTQMQNRRKILQSSLELTKGGKGRTKKLKALEKLSKNERNYVQTYNHMLSKKVVDFAKKNKCQYINLEKLTKDGFPDSILRNWSYYELQNYIEYKAKREGIEVRYVNPAYTSQKCSRCGHIHEDNRPEQEVFVCTKCGFGSNKEFKYGKQRGVNADHNAAINIGRSTDYK